MAITNQPSSNPENNSVTSTDESINDLTNIADLSDDLAPLSTDPDPGMSTDSLEQSISLTGLEITSTNEKVEPTGIAELASPDEVRLEDPKESFPYTLDTEFLDHTLEQLEPQVAELELDSSTQAKVNATVGTGILAVGSTLENTGDFIEESRMQRIKNFANKLSNKVKLLSITLSAGAIAAFGFELGPWNETVRANIGFDVFEKTLKELPTAAAVAASTVPIEFGAAALVALGLSRENMPGRQGMEWLNRKFGAGEKKEKERSKFSMASDIPLALSVGVATVVAKRFLTEKDMNLKEGLKTAAIYTPMAAVVAGAVGWGIAYGILHGEGSSYEGLAKFVERNGSDAKFWLAIAAVLKAPGWIYNNTGKRRNSDDKSDPSPSLSSEIEQHPEI